MRVSLPYHLLSLLKWNISMAIRILDIGQCGFDGPRMEKLWHKAIGATVDRCASSADALACAAQNDYDIILVNRVLDADGSSGLDVIRSLIEAGVSTPIMLVSDLPEAQDAAVQLGAVRGFGKAALGDPETIELVARRRARIRGRESAPEQQRLSTRVSLRP